jgi:hypothetical protein
VIETPFGLTRVRGPQQFGPDLRIAENRLQVQFRLLTFLCVCVLTFCYFVTARSPAPIQRARTSTDVATRKETAFVAASRAASLETVSLRTGPREGIGASVLSFFSRMADSSWSTGLHESRYAYDLIESVHVWTLCLFFGLAVMFDLRLLGWTMRNVPVSEVSRRLLPLTVVGFVIMVISGTLLFIAIPLRTYQNIFFRFKMVLLVLAGLNVWIFHSGVYRRVTTWELRVLFPLSSGSASFFREE